MPTSSAAVSGEFQATPYFTHKTKSVRSHHMFSIGSSNLRCLKGQPLETVQNSTSEVQTYKADVDDIPSVKR